VLKKIDVLAVEDSVVNAKMLHRALDSDRFNLKVYETAEKGLEAISEDKPDLVLMDVTLPGMNGYEACREIRKKPEFQLIPLIFLSARCTTAEKIKGYEAGGDDYLTKPFDGEELSAKLEKHAETSQDKRRMEQKVKQAISKAKKSESKAINLQECLKFLEKIAVCYTLDDMIGCLFDVMLRWGLRSTVQIRLPEKWLTLFDDDKVRELEISALEHISIQGRIIEFGPRCFINYDDVSLLIKNMPQGCQHTEPLHEYLFVMVEALHNRIITQAAEQRSQFHWKNLMRLLHDTHIVLDDSHRTLSMLLIENHRVFDAILDKIEASMSDMDLTESQEKIVLDTVRSGEDALEELYAQVLKEDERICNVVSQLSKMKFNGKL